MELLYQLSYIGSRQACHPLTKFTKLLPAPYVNERSEFYWRGTS